MMTEKVKLYWTDQHVQVWVQDLIRQMTKDQWFPDYVVGINSGGLVPAIMISQYLGVRLETLTVRLKDGESSESNCWMAEDAFGYVPVTQIPRPDDEARSDPSLRKKILVVNDINDANATIKWIKQDWQASACPDDPVWNEVWNNTVRFAVLIDDTTGLSPQVSAADYRAKETKDASGEMVDVFPWECWWQNVR
jgi:hypoxanthine phosphoribosyltransferase